MAKLDFSSLKTADLRSVAPVDESALPRNPSASSGGDSSDASGTSSQPASSQSSAAASAFVPAPAAPVAEAAQSAAAPASAPSPTARPAVAQKGRISLTSLKSGGTSVPSRTPSSVPAPAAPVAEAAQSAAAPAASAPVSAQHHAPKAKISLGTKPAVAISLSKKDVRETPAAPLETLPSPATDAGSAAVSESQAPVAEVSETASDDAAVRAPVIGVDIIEAAKVIGTEGESIANEILIEALTDPEAAKKAAEEKAVAELVIPDAGKEFFPNLEMDDGFFEDPLFEGIVPPKPEKKAVVAEEPVAEEAPSAIETPTVAEESVSEAASPEAAAEEAPEADAVSVVENRTEETEAVAEAAEEVPSSAEAPAAAEEAPAVGESSEAAVPVAETPASQEAYVEAVAKDLSAERKGGLAKLFWERKVLVRAVAGFFAVAVVWTGAFSLMGPEIKTSGPESANTGASQSELPPPIPKYVPTGETKIVTEGVRVISVRRPNVHKQQKTPLPEVSSGSASEESSGAVLPAEPNVQMPAPPIPSAPENAP